jgi:hypothetical protein
MIRAERDRDSCDVCSNRSGAAAVPLTRRPPSGFTEAAYSLCFSHARTLRCGGPVIRTLDGLGRVADHPMSTNGPIMMALILFWILSAYRLNWAESGPIRHGDQDSSSRACDGFAAEREEPTVRFEVGALNRKAIDFPRPRFDRSAGSGVLSVSPVPFPRPGQSEH